MSIRKRHRTTIINIEGSMSKRKREYKCKNCQEIRIVYWHPKLKIKEYVEYGKCGKVATINKSLYRLILEEV